MATERGSMAADLDMYTMAVDSAARSQDEEQLLAYLPIAEESVARVGHRLYQAVIRRARGVAHRLAGEQDEAAGQLAASVEEFRKLDTRWQMGRTLLELGEVEHARGNADLANEHYSEALTAFESLGATPYVNRARAALD
jgi:tetratricopeptide (TPR) repeat protein